jgi:tellurite resistance-related uncharacterized protein
MPLPQGAHPYRRTPTFTEATIPQGLLKAHATKDGVWGLVPVLSGRLLYRVTDPRRLACVKVLEPGAPPGVVEPTILHEVEPQGPVSFYVEFHRIPERRR